VSKLSPGTAGAVSELRVACYLLNLGWDVFRSLSPNGSTDLVAIKGRSRVLRIQVKSTLSLSQAKNLRAGRNHLLAVVVVGELHFRAINKHVAALIPGCTLARKPKRHTDSH
jgi:hypothetical protein